MLASIVTSVVGAVAADGVSRFSKTKLAANIGGFNVILALLPGVLAGDPQAIGQMVLLALTWIGTLWGRGNKG